MAPAPLTFLPGESEEARAANKMYQDALKKMVESLDARKNRMFDPTLLAMAQGFLTPGRTGSFGEALGQVAGNVRAAEAEQAKEEQQLAEMGLKVAQSNIAMQQQLERDRPYQEYFRKAAGAPTAGVPTAGASPAGAQGAAPPSGAQAPVSIQSTAAQAPSPAEAIIQQAQQQVGAVGKPINRVPIQNRMPDFDEFLRDQRSKGVSFTDAQAAWAKMLSDRIKVTDNFIFNTATGEIFQRAPDVDSVEVTLETQGGRSYKMTKAQAQELESLRQSNPEAARLWEQRFVNLPGGGTRPSTTESEAARTAATEAAQLREREEGKRRESLSIAGAAAQELLPSLELATEIAAKPHMKEILGRFSGGDLLSAAVRVAQSGIGTQEFRIAAADLQQNLQGLGRTTDQINDVNVLAMIAGRLQLTISKAAQGQGSISDRERALFATMGISSVTDPQKALLQKVAALSAKAEFDKKAAELFEDSNKTVSQFKRSKEFRELEDRYITQLKSIVSPPSSAPAAPAAAPQRPSDPLQARRNQLRQSLD